MPPVSIVELGMVVDVRVDADAVQVDLVPTYSGCPAIAVIREDVEKALHAMDDVASVEVRFVSSVVWEPERITGPGREKLKSFGIAPPGSGQVLVQIGARPRAVVCPLCGSTDTVADSPFGPTPCRSSSYCNACRNPFEVIKP
ncbi:MAG: phenylacetate-CoA oxygenase subunit PaaJ [Nitriliruptorales bacterium]|nr:phenylacetate-CoA oxygenase subunit PaaJ [Nitriliruptorales bacterium]